MTHSRRILSGVLTLLLLFSVSACGSSSPSPSAPEYPVMELVDISNMELYTNEDDSIKYQVPADKWIPGTLDNGALVAMYADTYGTNEQINITVSLSGYYGEYPLTEEYMREVYTMVENEMFMPTSHREMRSFNGSPLSYSEMTIQYTDESLDKMIEYGALTQEELDAWGGREVLLNLPAARMIMIYAVVDDHLVLYCGYFDENTKQEVLDAINVSIQTTEIK